MSRRLGLIAVAGLLLAVQVRTGNAQINVDTRGLGFGGWNSGSNPRVAGAQSRAIDAQTSMNVNEYLFQSQMETNRRYARRQAEKSKRVNETSESLMTRLRTDPTKTDVMKGDALNVAFDDITTPKQYSRTIQNASAPYPGAKIKAIPFQYASAAITTSIDDLTQTSATPSLLKQPEFKGDLTAFRALEADFKKKAESDAAQEQAIDPAQVKKAKNHVKSMSDILKKNAARFKQGSNEYRDADNYLKGLFMFVTMLESPSMTKLLAGVEEKKDTTLGDLIRFMHTSNLRFGVADSGQQQEIYDELFGLLNDLRGQVGAATPAESAKPEVTRTSPSKLFSGMEKMDISKLENLLTQLRPPASPEELKKLLPPPPRGNRRQPPPLPFKP